MLTASLATGDAEVAVEAGSRVAVPPLWTMVASISPPEAAELVGCCGAACCLATGNPPPLRDPLLYATAPPSNDSGTTGSPAATEVPATPLATGDAEVAVEADSRVAAAPTLWAMVASISPPEAAELVGCCAAA